MAKWKCFSGLSLGYHVAPLGNWWEGLCGYHFIFYFYICDVGWLQEVIGLCSMASSFWMKKQMLALHMGGNKGSWLQIWISTTKIKNPTLKSGVRISYKHNIVTLQQNGQKKIKKLHHWMLYLRGQSCAIFAWFKIVHLIQRRGWRFVSMDCLCVLNIHLLHTVHGSLCKTHPHVKGAIIWKIFQGNKLWRVHAYF